MHVYSDPALENHVNDLSGVEVPPRFPAAAAGIEAAERAGLSVERRSCEPAGRDALRRVHTLEYVDHLKGLSDAGGGYLDPDTALGPGSFEVAALASGAACGAVESALGGEAAFAVVRPPGHHSGADYAMGFCLFNHAAVAAAHASSLGAGRVAVLDWDVHHGNGTQDIFYADGDVLYLSVHRSPFYPGTGKAGETGEGEGLGFTANVPLPGRSGEDAYAAAFAGVLVPVLREYGPGLLIVSAGYDAHAADPLGGMGLEADSFARFAALLCATCRELGAPPPAFVLEGGYDLDALSRSVTATVRGAYEDAPEWEYAGGVGPVEESRAALAPYWKSLR
ncbi:MAG: Deacetylases, including yeast histone deacetylase and acetoin utilization protein [uncultured Rubrobacteraceae bacterium]|uniref:Deacetylases, including yeast histone deacetylase and acetoin utilization protein n=1 Tax=uncultured Rubrobacteraceae bacterium TaxID=349277 RepID=A0A6J4NX59_9ACTN|nr:MAG: Deacetylases, including yeast histone deacetylase and acetoin utilization protein [uncultured Rubrobacteraceae bacterium]